MYIGIVFALIYPLFSAAIFVFLDKSKCNNDDTIALQLPFLFFSICELPALGFLWWSLDRMKLQRLINILFVLLYGAILIPLLLAYASLFLLSCGLGRL